MDFVVEDWSGTHGTTRSTPPNSSDLSSKRQKKIVDDLFSVANWEEGINSSKFGTVTQEIQALLARRAEMMKPFLRKVYIDASPRKEDLPAHHPIINVDDDIAGNSIAAQSLIIIDSDDDEKPKNQMLSQPHQNTVVKNPTGEVPLEHSMEGDYAQGQNCQILMVVGDASLSMESNSTKDMKGVHVSKEGGREGKGEFTSAQGKTLIEGDASLVDESKSKKCAKSLYASQEDGSSKGKGEYVGVEDMEIEEENQQTLIEGDASLVDESKSKKCAKSLYASQEDGSSKGKGEYVGVEDMEFEEENQQTDVNFDDLADIWKEMNFGLECSKDIVPELTSNESKGDGGEDCNEHSYIFKDDLGYVCRICGVISKKIETIIEYQYPKSTRSTRTYHYEGRTAKDGAVAKFNLDGTRVSENDFSGAEIYAHPRHKKQMKPHQVEGFNFLLSNLVTENPGGCILAHAPGSGKTFMLISFIQSFMAKYPSAKPLVILPVGILPTWKKEFKRWQVEDFQLFDFYSVKAENRSQQLVVLNQWMDQRSILFLGYKQFSSIICDSDTGKITTKCQDILLTCPSILIMDEGHTPRNQDTDVLTSLEKVQTPRKVVLSGTLYQNHVKEVFNILNLVRPRFLKLETSKSIKKRILSRVSMSSKKNTMIKGTDNEFYDLVELTLVKDDNFKRKVTVIEDLREMTSKVLHYYKGDFLDELPGLVDFSVFLDLSPKQKREVSMLRKSAQKFKVSSDGSAIYVHPKLKSLTKNPMVKDRVDEGKVKDRVDEGKIDELLAKLDLQDGVKAKFFLNLLNLCESGGEKLLVFGQYLLPLKFLERLAMKVKGWSPGKEIFMITGDSDSTHREISMDSFNSSSDARVFFGSIKACGEGISLVGASRIIILDVHLNPSVTRQAIGRAFRPGQERKVYTYRLVAANAPEEEDHYTCFRKESISKMWFEWDEYCGHNEFEMEKADVSDCGDQFLETSRLNEDVVALYKR